MGRGGDRGMVSKRSQCTLPYLTLPGRRPVPGAAGGELVRQERTEQPDEQTTS